MTILIDYSQVCMANVYAFQKDLKKTSTDREGSVNIIRHAVLTGLKYYRHKFANYGDMVIACDGRNYWRKDAFPYYKANRSKNREKSDLDWKLIFDTISAIREDLIQHFPYKVIHFDHTEADDIIAAVCKRSQTHGMIDHGMFEDKQPIVIVSSDGDFKQLHKFDNVKQWSPIQKKAVTCSDPKPELLEKIATGDTGDGVPNVLSDDAVLITEGVRQNKMMAKRLEQFKTLGREACQNDTERRNWDRNNALINLDLIPTSVYDTIIDSYENQKPKGDKMTIYGYLVKNRMRLLLDDIESF